MQPKTEADRRARLVLALCDLMVDSGDLPPMTALGLAAAHELVESSSIPDDHWDHLLRRCAATLTAWTIHPEPADAEPLGSVADAEQLVAAAGGVRGQGDDAGADRERQEHGDAVAVPVDGRPAAGG